MLNKIARFITNVCIILLVIVTPATSAAVGLKMSFEAFQLWDKEAGNYPVIGFSLAFLALACMGIYIAVAFLRDYLSRSRCEG